jgi:hypothetical protein
MNRAADVMKISKRVLLLLTACALSGPVSAATVHLTAQAEEVQNEDVEQPAEAIPEDNTEDQAKAPPEEIADAQREDASEESVEAQNGAGQAQEGALQPVSVGYAYTPTSEELVLMANVIYREAGNQGIAGQVAVAQVIINRVVSPAYPDTIAGVLSQRVQFNTYKAAAAIPAEATSPDLIAVCQGVISGGHDVFGNKAVIGFRRNNGAQSFCGHPLFAVIGDHAFYSY